MRTHLGTTNLAHTLRRLCSHTSKAATGCTSRVENVLWKIDAELDTHRPFSDLTHRALFDALLN
jgi:hypothetical protein